MICLVHPMLSNKRPLPTCGGFSTFLRRHTGSLLVCVGVAVGRSSTFKWRMRAYTSCKPLFPSALWWIRETLPSWLHPFPSSCARTHARTYVRTWCLVSAFVRFFRLSAIRAVGLWHRGAARIISPVVPRGLPLWRSWACWGQRLPLPRWRLVTDGRSARAHLRSLMCLLFFFDCAFFFFNAACLIAFAWAGLRTTFSIFGVKRCLVHFLCCISLYV